MIVIVVHKNRTAYYRYIHVHTLLYAPTVLEVIRISIENSNTYTERCTLCLRV
jgi:hypothetical protein